MTGMGLLALSRHQFQEALEWGLRAHRLNPQNSRNLGIIGDAYVELGRYPQAWEAFQQMVNLRPDLSSYTRISYARELTGDIPGAIEAMNQALVAGGSNTESTLWTRVQLGHIYFNSGDVVRAEEEYRRALSLAPGYVHAEAALARVMAAKGLDQESVALYQAVVDRYPFPEYVIALGDVHTVAGNKAAAAQAYALVRIQQRLYQDSGVNIDLELALFDADHHQNLLEALARARREYQRRPSIHAADVLAWTLYKNGEIQEAERYAAEALRLGTKDALMLFHAGMIHYRLGDREKAKELLEEAVAVNPHFSVLYRDEVRRTLEVLRKESVEHRTSERK
jgi:tetratricopeptide (TPR) repeat protein